MSRFASNVIGFGAALYLVVPLLSAITELMVGLAELFFIKLVLMPLIWVAWFIIRKLVLEK